MKIAVTIYTIVVSECFKIMQTVGVRFGHSHNATANRRQNFSCDITFDCNVEAIFRFHTWVLDSVSKPEKILRQSLRMAVTFSLCIRITKN